MRKLRKLRKLSSIVNKYVFNDFQLSDYRIRRWYIVVDSDTIVHLVNRFVADEVSNVIDRGFANMVDEVIFREFPLSSLERLRITESILEEL